MSYYLLVRNEVTGMVEVYKNNGETCILVDLFYFMHDAVAKYPSAFYDDDDFFETIA